MSLENALENLKPLHERGEITAWVKLAARPGCFQDFPADLAPPLRKALLKRGLKNLYSHQAETFDLARCGEHLVVVTPTASGKTLAYNLPVLSDLIHHPEHRALYLFPTKALAQDQLAELNTLIQDTDVSIGVNTYDGDTPGDQRRKIRQEARIVLTNPDMLHSAILPHHPKWIQLLQNLRFVVVDELHVYRGVFGSHVANVFRRLTRVAKFHGSSPQFFCTSATIANPDELARRLLERPVCLIQKSGAPSSKKDLIFYNPPLVNPELGLRRSAVGSAKRFAEMFLKQGLQSLIFATSRLHVEVLLRYLKKAVERDNPGTEMIRGYRGGYLPDTRRDIEKKMRSGEILGIVSTNALELGIDLGSLEACVLAGYPGSISSVWQQVGRVGRRNSRAAAVLVARNLPLDQFIVNHPSYFLDQSPEHGRIFPNNLQIMVSHIQCAAFELPFHEGEGYGIESLQEILIFLANEGCLLKQGKRWFWTDESYPADSVSLRNVPDDNFIIFDRSDGNRAIAEVDFDSAPELIHQEAIYLCDGNQYQVQELDYAGRKAYVKAVTVDYYTDAITYSSLRILHSDAKKENGRCVVEYGEICLVKKVPGFKKIRFYTSENIGYGKVSLPTHELHTSAYWFSLPGEIPDLGLTRDQVVRGLLGSAYALHSVATLILMCDVRDLGRSVGDRFTTWFAQGKSASLGFTSAAGDPTEILLDGLHSFEPTLYLYDNCPGGVGFSELLFESHPLLLERTSDLVRSCSCKWGCPSCVGPVEDLGEEMKGLSLEILKYLGAVSVEPPSGC